MTSVLTRSGLGLRPCTDPERWDRAVAEHPDGTPFHLAGFLRTVGGLVGLQVHLTELTVDDEAVGLLPLLVRSRGPLVSVNHALPVPYIGPLLPAGVSHAAAAEAVHRFLRPQPVVHIGVQVVRPFEVPTGPGWTAFDGYDRAVVSVADLDDDALLARFARPQRSLLRRAEREGVTVGPATREEIAGPFTEWSNLPFARQGLPPRWPAGAHLAVHDAMAPSGDAATTAVRRDGELLAISTDFVLGARAVGWELGLSEAGRAVGATTLLCFDGMRRARDHGAGEYDLLGAPTPGIAAFKRSLGAEMRPRGVGLWVSPAVPAVRSLASAARASARLARRLPGVRS